MINPSPRSVSVYSILSNSYGNSGKLLRHAAWLHSLEQRLQAHLDKPLGQHCRVANYANQTLTLHTDSPAWAAKLRFLTPDIVNYMRTGGPLTDIKTVRIRVSPPANRRTAPGRQLALSQPAADHLHDVALSMTDANLRQSLLRLSKHR